MTAIARLLPIIARNHRSAAPPAGPTRVGITQFASGPTSGQAPQPIVVPGIDVQAGDLIVVLLAALNSINQDEATVVPSDTGGNTFVGDYRDTQSSNTYEFVWHAIAGADQAGNALSLPNGAGNVYGQLVVAVYRAPAGKTWAFDSTNFGLTVGAYSPDPITRTFDVGGPGVVLAMCTNANASNGATGWTEGDCTGADIRAESPPNTTLGYGYFSFVADLLTDAALTNHTVTGQITNAAGDAYARRDLLIAPFTYS